MSTYTFNGTGKLTQAIVTNADLAGNNISKVVISGYTSIGDQAFYQATTLTSITIPASVTSIGDEAFYQATALTSITIPSGVTSIGPYTFYDASSLTSITIPASVTSIGDSAFQDASSLTSVTFRTGSQLTSIGTYAFRRASSLISITIPSGVTTIGSGTFQDATALTSITIPASVNAIEGYAFAGASALTSIIIPSGVISIGEQAFVSASSLTSIIIPSSVTTIGDDAFFISGLTQATINAARLGEANFPTALGANQTIGGKKNVTILAAITQENIQTAVNAWVANPTAAGATYGHIKDWDTSSVTDMSNLFNNKQTFNDDISRWNTSNVTSMEKMFYQAYLFNQNISTKDAGTYAAWATRNVTSMSNMFNMNTVETAEGNFNNGQAAGESTAPMNWNTSKVTTFSFLFRSCRKFNQNCSTASVTLRGVTYTAWDTSNVTDMTRTFAYCESFNNGEPRGSSTKPLYWNTSNVTLMTYMFGIYNFLVDIGAIVSKYNQSMTSEPVTIGGVTYTPWDVSKVTNMVSMFQDSGINQPLNSWNVSAVTNMSSMFRGADAFNQSLNSWNVSAVTNMGGIFNVATAFNGDISSWNVSAVTDMSFMFYGATAFNQPLNSWNVSKVNAMNSMFSGGAAAFNQPLNSWDVSAVTNMSFMFNGATAFNGDISSWNVSKVTNISSLFQNASSFNKNINSWDVSTVTDIRYMFSGAAAFNQPLNSWNVSAKTSMYAMFANAVAFNQPLNSWNMSAVTDTSYMFYGATAFNQPLNLWNVSAVTNMSYMFYNATTFNGDIGSWNVSKVTNIDSLFQNASSFNRNINLWDVSKVTSMGTTFGGATAFNQPLYSWNVSSNTNFGNTFNGATSFNQEIKDWNVGKVTYMTNMFNGATVFSRDLARWVVSHASYGSESEVTIWFKTSTGGGIQLSEISFYDNNNSKLSVVSAAKPSTNNDGTTNYIDLKSGRSEGIEKTYDNNTSTKWWSPSVGSVKFTLNGIPSSYTFTTANDNNPYNRTPVTWTAYYKTSVNTENHTGETNYTTATQQNLFILPAGGTKFTLLTPAQFPLGNMFKGTPMGTNGVRQPKSDTPPLSYFNQAPCFDQDTLILCPTGNICVKDLNVGDEVVTSSGIKRILRIANMTRMFNNTRNVSTTMYRMKKTDDMTGDLLVTGLHAILLDSPELHYDGKNELIPETKKVDGKYSIVAGMYHKFERETIPREHTIYHIAVDGDKDRYGLIANGVLMESWDKKQTYM